MAGDHGRTTMKGRYILSWMERTLCAWIAREGFVLQDELIHHPPSYLSLLVVSTIL